jgi:hypothetical protein
MKIVTALICSLVALIGCNAYAKREWRELREYDPACTCTFGASAVIIKDAIYHPNVGERISFEITPECLEHNRELFNMAHDSGIVAFVANVAIARNGQKLALVTFDSLKPGKVLLFTETQPAQNDDDKRVTVINHYAHVHVDGKTE